MKEEYINKLSKEIYNQNVEAGWWDDPDRCKWQTLQLVSTEVAEATEGARKDLMDDHLPQYKMEQVELADALIRVLDFGGRYDYEYNELGVSYHFVGSDASAGSNHLGINVCLIDFVKAVYLEKEKSTLNQFYSALIECILQVARARGYNLAQPLSEKLEYNKRRLDHKRDARSGDGGKKF